MGAFQHDPVTGSLFFFVSSLGATPFNVVREKHAVLPARVYNKRVSPFELLSGCHRSWL